MHKLKRVVYTGDMESAALLHCAWVIEYFQELDVPLHTNLRKYYQVLIKKVSVTGFFLTFFCIVVYSMRRSTKQ